VKRNAGLDAVYDTFIHGTKEMEEAYALVNQSQVQAYLK
jgi:hypothetical protein